ncbi:MAG: Stk1 family PASTA domain-containing Ser/Thr kinase, partial [Thermoleophilaceae bacterium]|nr:Stk1 family PASTA domain-containing Ser/Thr kinase [Thermoleophilaceae bacterium]
MTEVAVDSVVDGRYRILGRIGSGGMADVYRAEDTHLGREVALKMLHRRFAQDAEFVERFRREAKSAAGLQHPNVVGVFDRGEYDGTYYIAMECLQGRTLKEVVVDEAPIDQLRVIDLGVQILQAAGFAHRNGVIHRDFKPHNVIVDDGGHAKVTDFGIARAGASEMTETGSIMGTAQYLSPEQAQGHPVTAASDLYSIGVMLYELLTGRIPFEGDSAVSIALKHLSAPPPPMSGDGLAIEPNLESVVMGALAKDPAARWQTGEDFAGALEACRPYVEAHGEGAPLTQSTAVFAALPGPATDRPVTEVRTVAPVITEPPLEEAHHRRRWPAVALALLVLALIGLMAYAFSRPEQVDVPKVVGLNVTDARERLDKAGFETVRIERERSFASEDSVLRQDPDPGEQAAKDDPVTLAISDGPGKVRVPSVRNLPEERAFKELEKADLKVTADPQPSTEVKKGFAVGTSPGDGTEVDRRSRVRLFVSSGPERITVPNVVGLSRESAESRLDREGLTVQVQVQASDKPKDEVIAQSPGEGSKLDAGNRVTITVSEGTQKEGTQKVGVPDVEGLAEGDALRMLR